MYIYVHICGERHDIRRVGKITQRDAERWGCVGGDISGGGFFFFCIFNITKIIIIIPVDCLGRQAGKGLEPVFFRWRYLFILWNWERDIYSL